MRIKLHRDHDSRTEFVEKIWVDAWVQQYGWMHVGNVYRHFCDGGKQAFSSANPRTGEDNFFDSVLDAFRHVLQNR